MSYTRLQALQDMDTLYKTAGWTKFLFAADSSGRGITPTSEKACRFCLVGALERVLILNVIDTTERLKLTSEILDLFCEVLVRKGVFSVITTHAYDHGHRQLAYQANDSLFQSKEDVVRIINEAISLEILRSTNGS